MKRAAFASFGIAGLAGLALVIMTQYWWLLAVGVACVLAAWYYTGGKRPYGYAGLGEVFVFVFFGLVAVCGTAYVQVGRVSLATLLTGVVGRRVGLRDLGDQQPARHPRRCAGWQADAGHEAGGRQDAGPTSSWSHSARADRHRGLAHDLVLLGLAGLVLIIPAVRVVTSGGSGPALIGVLKATSLAELASAIGFSAGLMLYAAWSP